MDFLIGDALRKITAATILRVANAARPPGDYLWAQFLPERDKPTYNVETAGITVRTTMAGLVAMDSPYPPGGVVQLSGFTEKLPKLGIEARLTEENQRKFQEQITFLLAQQAMARTDMPKPLDYVVNTILNFNNKVLVQAHLDRREWMRGKALQDGAIDWTFNKKRLNVKYGVPTANMLTRRTGNDNYGGSTSKFWADMRAANSLLNWDIRARIIHPAMLEFILANDANKIAVLPTSVDGQYVDLVRLVGSQERQSTDKRDYARLYIYGKEAEILDVANAGQTTIIPFVNKEKITIIGNRVNTPFTVNIGATEPTEIEMGYTHIGPTIENGGRMGLYSRVYRPEAEPWAFVGQAAGNYLPVIEPDGAKKIVNLESEIA